MLARHAPRRAAVVRRARRDRTRHRRRSRTARHQQPTLSRALARLEAQVGRPAVRPGQPPLAAATPTARSCSSTPAGPSPKCVRPRSGSLRYATRTRARSAGLPALVGQLVRTGSVAPVPAKPRRCSSNCSRAPRTRSPSGSRADTPTSRSPHRARTGLPVARCSTWSGCVWRFRSIIGSPGGPGCVSPTPPTSRSSRWRPVRPAAAHRRAVRDSGNPPAGGVRGLEIPTMEGLVAAGFGVAVVPVPRPERAEPGGRLHPAARRRAKRQIGLAWRRTRVRCGAGPVRRVRTVAEFVMRISHDVD